MDLDLLERLLIKHEGFRNKPYVDTVGKITIGVGHNLTDLGLTSVQVMSLLKADMADVVAFIDARMPWVKDLDSVRQVAVADLVFNMGSKFLTFVNTIKAMQNNQWDIAADNLLASLYAKQVGQRAKDIAQMIRTGHEV